MKRALIITVGTGTKPEANIVAPLVKTVKQSHPDYVGLLASKKTQKNAQKIIDETKYDEEHSIIWELYDEDDIEAVFWETNKMIRQLHIAGFEAANIAVDYTSGTKAMTGGLLLAALANECSELKYITGKRKDGTVIPGTEKILSIAPSAILASRDIRKGIHFIEVYRFSSAMDLYQNINPHLLDDYDRYLLENLILAAEAYDSWDKFNHHQSRKILEKIDFTIPELKSFHVGRGTLFRLKKIGNTIHGQVINEDIVADLYNNAARRFEEGKYDDAVARLYRLTEMTGQWALWSKHGINSSDVDLEKVPEENKTEIELHKGHDGVIKIGLRASFGLLAAKGEELGKDYISNKKLGGNISNRNQSILAHGVKPITEQECATMLRELKKFLGKHIPDFYIRIDELRFPWTPSINRGQENQQDQR